VLWRGTDLNRQPMAYESTALPIELPRLLAEKVYYDPPPLSTMRHERQLQAKKFIFEQEYNNGKFNTLGRTFQPRVEDITQSVPNQIPGQYK
jgi:hypothetical protein